jgi:hypothetical protein
VFEMVGEFNFFHFTKYVFAKIEDIS